MAAVWGRWAVALAVVQPISYAVIPWAWARGVPLGITAEFLAHLHTTGLSLACAALATLAAGGAVLTLGLVQPWGERFPRWMPVLAGNRVPPLLAIVPASIMSVSVFDAGLTALLLRLAKAMEVTWMANPVAGFSLWRVALAMATLA